MSATEFAFLAFGLVLGIASGAGLAFVIRARPAPPREVRVTVAPDSIARRRPATLASTELLDHSAAAIGAEVQDEARTPVLTESPISPDAAAPVARPTLPDTAVAIPIQPDPGLVPFALPMPVATRTPSGSPPPEETRPTAPGASASRPRTARVMQEGPTASGGARWGERPAAAPAAAAAETDPTSDPCAGARQAAEERCTLAERNRTFAREAAEALGTARREYDEHRNRADAAEALLDPRAVRDAKDAAQQAFRGARGTATDPEAAARDWLHEINRINTAAREAQGVAEHERQLLLDLLPRLDRLELEADAARIAAESAEVTCREARAAVARCQEDAVTAAKANADAASMASAASSASWAPTGPPDLGAPLGSGTIGAAMAVGAGGAPAILRLLRGDRAMLERLVAALGSDPVDRRQWQRRMTDLVDAIVARAIEASYLDFPDDHRFWGPFTRSQYRDIVSALASLGFRFDGLGGWADERVPSQRDLSLAVGYAGLDPMRIRHWPTEPEMETLFRTAFVSADEWLAGAAGELTLGEMVDALGRRADDLPDVWNEWGRVRPLLLDTE